MNEKGTVCNILCENEKKAISKEGNEVNIILTF